MYTPFVKNEQEGKARLIMHGKNLFGLWNRNIFHLSLYYGWVDGYYRVVEFDQSYSTYSTSEISEYSTVELL